MILRDWEIWYSYSTYFLEEFQDLGSIAKSLIQCDLCTVVQSSYGIVWWKEDGEVKEQELKVERDKTGSEGKITFPKGFAGYVREALYQAVNMCIYEEQLFNSKYLENSVYIRGYLDACYLKDDEYILHLYPQIKIYKNGTIHLSFRVIAPGKDHPIDIDKFTKKFVNLYNIIFKIAEVPPSWVRLYTRALILKSSRDIIDRDKSIKKIKKFNRYINPLIRSTKEEDFTFKEISLDVIGGEGPHLIKQIQFFSTMLNECIDYVVNQTSADFIYILKGMDKKRYHLGNYWVGRPSIYIIEFDEQPETSPDIIRDYGTEVRKILSRISGSNFLKVGDFLEPNLRKFDDYDVYMNEALTLWIYSKKGLARWGDEKDPKVVCRIFCNLDSPVIPHISIRIHR